MRNYNFYATLSTEPTNCNHHELLYITRGATAELTYDLSDKVYNLTDIDQMIFTFKQHKNINWYTLFTYYELSKDIEVVEGKNYYQIETADTQGDFKCLATLVATPSGNPSEQNYYEISTAKNASWKTTYYEIDPHFYIEELGNYSYISFIMGSDETKQLKATTPGNPMQFEIAIRLNTDIYESYHNRDSIIIEPQHPIAVVNSLFSLL